MELNISKTLNTQKNNNVSKFLNELKEEQNKKIKLSDIKIDEKSSLSLANNIAENNKMTNENREKFFQEEEKSLFNIYSKDKKAGDLYYIESKGSNDELYVFKIGKNIEEYSDHIQLLDSDKISDEVKIGGIYREKDGEIVFNKKETKELEKSLKSSAKEILNNQEENGGYKKEFTKNDLVLGEGYEGDYFQYTTDIVEEYADKAEIPPTMINGILKNDIRQAFIDIAKELSKDKTIYMSLPGNKFDLYEFSDGEMKLKEYSGNTSDLYDNFGSIYKFDKDGELDINSNQTKIFKSKLLDKFKNELKQKYDNICKDYKKEGHIYEVEKSLDENYVATITLKDLSENKFLEIEDLDFIENEYLDEGYYTVKDGKYYKINAKKEIPKNHTVDKEKEDNLNLANIMAKKYGIEKELVEEKLKEFMIEKSEELGAVVYTGYDKSKDEYYLDYYLDGEFDEREKISKEKAYEFEVGTFCTMGEDEFNRYSGFFDEPRFNR